MRLSVAMDVLSGELHIPLRGYQSVLQGFIYNHMDLGLARGLHDKGARPGYGGRAYRLFTFSRIRGGCIERGSLRFSERYGKRLSFEVAAYDERVLSSLAAGLLEAEELSINAVPLGMAGIDSSKNPEADGSDGRVILKTLSPITEYATNPKAEKKRSFYRPDGDAWQSAVSSNLVGKQAAVSGEEDPEATVVDPPWVCPLEGASPTKVVCYPKSSDVVVGYTGLFEAYLPPPYLDIALDTGLGAKNSMGFGMVEVAGFRPSGGASSTNRREGAAV